MKNAHEQLLEMAAFNREEMKAIQPVWEHTAAGLGLTEDDVAFAAFEWLPRQWDLGLMGVRKMLGILLRELMSLRQAGLSSGQQTALIYFVLPFPPALPLAVKIVGGHRVTTAAPDILLSVILGAVFHKHAPLLDFAEEQGLMKADCRHCALNKTRVATTISSMVPPPDAAWVAGLCCDEGPKTDEYVDAMGHSSWPAFILRMPQDAPFQDPDEGQIERSEYLKEQIDHGLSELGRLTGLRPQKSDLAAAHKRYSSYAAKLAWLTSLAVRGQPPPLGGFESALFGLPQVMPFNVGLDSVEEALDLLIVEVRHRRAQGRGMATPDAPRLLAYQVPYALPGVSRLFEQNGAPLIGSLTTLAAPMKLDILLDDDPLLHIAQGWLNQWGVTGLGREARNIVALLDICKPDGLIMGLFDFDRWLGSRQRLLAHMVHNITGRLTLYLEGDFWDDRGCDRERMVNRIESIREIVLNHRHKK